ncbi:MAG: methylmalonyl Co-A mutase-associated GTPase MeaB [bacterium]|nr:methylmalonyl Co-A mutase-associated GTPase MeaB [bacterium]
MSAEVELAAALADPAALGRLLTRVENDATERKRILGMLPEVAQPAYRIGVTGSPGVGKSTLLAKLVPLLAVDGARPAVLAIDPTSTHTGGAVLGDRFRWNELSEQGVFMRSLASRGSLGGTSAAAGAVLRVLDAAGYGPLVIETVGVGQIGFEISALADTVVVLLSPESGDALQLLKAGLIEAGNIFVVNKSDRPGAAALLSELRSALEKESEVATLGWQQRVLSVVAQSGAGVAELAAAISAHRLLLQALPADHSLRLRRAAAEISYGLRGHAEEALRKVMNAELPGAVESVSQGQLSVEEATTELVNSLARMLRD